MWRWGAFHLGEEGLGEVVGITAKEGNRERIRKHLDRRGGYGVWEAFLGLCRGARHHVGQTRSCTHHHRGTRRHEEATSIIIIIGTPRNTEASWFCQMESYLVRGSGDYISFCRWARGGREFFLHFTSIASLRALISHRGRCLITYSRGQTGVTTGFLACHVMGAVSCPPAWLGAG